VFAVNQSNKRALTLRSNLPATDILLVGPHSQQGVLCSSDLERLLVVVGGT
jgi:hypothetical protein